MNQKKAKTIKRLVFVVCKRENLPFGKLYHFVKRKYLATPRKLRHTVLNQI